MLKKKRNVLQFFALLVVGGLILSACGEQEPEVIEKVVTQVVKETVVIEATSQVIEQEVTKIVEVEKVVTATPPSMVGGTLVRHLPHEIDSLDPHKTNWSQPAFMLGASLVAQDPSGKIVPWLAEKWEASEDGLTWDFTLRRDVKFHDGTPLTAQDYAWTFQRMVDPETQAGVAASLFAPIASAEAVDDYTLRINLHQPFFPFLFNLAIPTWAQPLSQAAVEAAGDQYARQPVGVGPYKFKEWITGEKVILERNPDYTWGPAFTHGGPFYIETIEYRTILEESTALAGLEAGEIDYAGVKPKDLDRIRDTGSFQILEGLTAGLHPYLTLNVSKPPFDDLRARQAFNLAVDRDTLIRVVMQGEALPQYGPLSPSVIGYWPGVEEIGYGYDLEAAKALMAEAGYTVGSDGILEKDGERLELTLLTVTSDPSFVKVAEVLQAQYKDLGVAIEIKQVEENSALADLIGGNYEVGVMNVTYPEADLMFLIFHSSQLGGGFNMSQVNDPELDSFLDLSRSETDPDARQEAVNQAQKRVIEQAYIVPLYTPKLFNVLSIDVKDAVYSLAINQLYLDDAYISK